MSENKLRLVEPEDLYRFKYLLNASLSPDGKTVAYTVTEADAEEMKEHAAIWLCSIETGGLNQLTAGTFRDSNPQWSPDGDRIAFLSTRGEKTQIYVIPVDGGEAQAVTSLPQGVGGPFEWSPDGCKIAFTAGPQEEPPDPKEPYRVTRRIYRFNGMGYLDRVVQDVYTVSIDGGEVKKLTTGDAHKSAPSWSPDGREILYSATFHPDSYVLSAAIMVVNMDGEVREVMKGWGSAMSPTWLPDGRKIAFIGGPEGEPAGTQRNLHIIDRMGGVPECRTSTLDYSVGGGLQSDMPSAYGSRIVIDGEGKNAYVRVQVGGNVPVYRIALDGQEECSPVVHGERNREPLGLYGDSLLYKECGLNQPPDLYVSDDDGGNEKRLTDINRDLLGSLSLPSVEHLKFPSSDGVEIEGWLMKPSKGEPPYPMVLYIHGGPHSGFGNTFSFDFQMLAGAGYAVLFINQRGSTGYGDAFATKIIGDWGNLDYKDLMAGVDAAIERGIVDPDRMGVCGLSGGGNLSCWIVGNTDRFKAAVPENPVTNFVSFYGVSDIGPYFGAREMGGLPHEIPETYRRCSPITYAHRCKTPTLLIQGEYDHRCPPEQSEQFYSVLKANGCTVEMVRLPESYHTGSINGALKLRKAQNDALLDWMNKYVLT